MTIVGKLPIKAEWQYAPLAHRILAEAIRMKKITLNNLFFFKKKKKAMYESNTEME